MGTILWQAGWGNEVCLGLSRPASAVPLPHPPATPHSCLKKNNYSAWVGGGETPLGFYFQHFNVLH